MKKIGKNFLKDFEKMLTKRCYECKAFLVKDPKTDIQQLLMDKGMPYEEALDIYLEIDDVRLDNMRAAYSQGIKDGTGLMLHLLGKEPEFSITKEE